jgi:hypothetical protein
MLHGPPIAARQSQKNACSRAATLRSISRMALSFGGSV